MCQDVIHTYGYLKNDGVKKLVTTVINTPVQKACRRGRRSWLNSIGTLWCQSDAVLAYFDIGASNGPIEVIKGRLEHLRGISLSFRNLDHRVLVITDPPRAVAKPD